MSEMSREDRALVLAFRDAYRAAADGFVSPEEDEDVLELLHEHGVVTERQAEIVGHGQALADLAGED